MQATEDVVKEENRDLSGEGDVQVTVVGVEVQEPRLVGSSAANGAAVADRGEGDDISLNRDAGEARILVPRADHRLADLYVGGSRRQRQRRRCRDAAARPLDVDARVADVQGHNDGAVTAPGERRRGHSKRRDHADTDQSAPSPHRKPC
jgi:hypothetical protein